MPTLPRHLTAATAALLMLGGTSVAAARTFNDNGPGTSPRATTTTSFNRSSLIAPDPKCVRADLGIRYVDSQAATAMFISTLQFINVSGHECHLIGYPGVAVYGRGGQRLHVKLARESFTGRQPQRVRLRARGRASFELVTTAFRSSGQRCANAYRIRVTPPNDYSSLSIRHKLLICGFIGVSAVESPH